MHHIYVFYVFIFLYFELVPKDVQGAKSRARKGHHRGVAEPEGSRTERSAEREKQLEGRPSARTAVWEWERVWQEADKTPGIPSHRTNKESDHLEKEQQPCPSHMQAQQSCWQVAK